MSEITRLGVKFTPQIRDAVFSSLFKDSSVVQIPGQQFIAAAVTQVKNFRIVQWLLPDVKMMVFISLIAGAMWRKGNSMYEVLEDLAKRVLGVTQALDKQEVFLKKMNEDRQKDLRLMLQAYDTIMKNENEIKQLTQMQANIYLQQTKEVNQKYQERIGELENQIKECQNVILTHGKSFEEIAIRIEQALGEKKIVQGHINERFEKVLDYYLRITRLLGEEEKK